MSPMKTKPGFPKILIKIIAALSGGILLFVFVVGLSTLGFRAIYDGRIFPGIYLGPVNLSGQVPTDAAELLRGKYSYPEEGRINLQYDDFSWEAAPAKLGLFFSPNYNAELAFNTGRASV